jgi:putative restriction endonuclease
VIGTIAITDLDWYSFLSAHSETREINFWTPSARRAFRAPAFSPFLFKLRAPHNAICGFAYFAQYSHLPDWLAWDLFGLGNGCESLDSMRGRITAIRERIGYEDGADSAEIGCIQLVAPTFFPPAMWIPQPIDWRVRTQRPTRYDLSGGEGQRVWEACSVAAAELSSAETGASLSHVRDHADRYGSPHLVEPRLGQATFRVAVLDAYGRACAVTEEHSLPALEAVHIRPYAAQGPHEIPNGILLRADLHRLFDTGYITVTPDLRLNVGQRLKREFHNGRSYYPLHGRTLRSPTTPELAPSPDYLRWHNERCFLG